ncbi:MAG: hypothetical protein D3910_27440, partial [Candidatus Electrothrix sp. ATG2]|nr:hypothetical protein [Candidatus Electrothrix sp. ATG2]
MKFVSMVISGCVSSFMMISGVMLEQAIASQELDYINWYPHYQSRYEYTPSIVYPDGTDNEIWFFICTNHHPEWGTDGKMDVIRRLVYHPTKNPQIYEPPGWFQDDLMIFPPEGKNHTCDPSVVQEGGQWHMFVTVDDGEYDYGHKNAVYYSSSDDGHNWSTPVSYITAQGNNVYTTLKNDEEQKPYKCRPEKSIPDDETLLTAYWVGQPSVLLGQNDNQEDTWYIYYTDTSINCNNTILRKAIF